ncbi:MAG: SDR family oxidoreductase [Chloroflexota bacterium]
MTHTALITGGSSGIGFELAKCFAWDGYRLFLVALEADELARAQSELHQISGQEVFILQKDLSVLGAAEEVYDFTRSNGLTIDVLVNNAGFGSHGYFSETSLEHEQKMLLLNNVALMTLTKLFLHEMQTRNRGHILNISSTAGLQPSPAFAAYGASKQFVHNFSMALNYELKVQKSGIKVTVICPPATRTPFGKRANMENHPVFSNILTMNPDQVALATYHAMQAGRARLILPSWSAWIQTGLYRLLPLRAIMGLVHQGLKK